MLNSKKRKKKPANSNAIRKSLFKVVAVFLLVAINLTGLSAVSGTGAYFNDKAEISEIIATAGSLDFAVSSLTDFSTPVTPSQNIAKSISVGNYGSLDFQYIINASDFSGNLDLCGDLMIDAKLDGNSIYAGKLLEFVAPTTTLATSVSAVLDLELSLSSSNDELKNQVCNFNLSVIGWQTDFSSASQGFSHSEVIANLVSSGDWTNEEPPETIYNNIVLNEFLPNPTGADNADMPAGEWVELYNNEDVAVDVAGWYLHDSTNGNGNKTLINSEHILASSTVISAHSWLVVYMNKSIYNNTGDTVKLFDSSDVLIDSYEYVGDVAENKSYARIPDGTGGWVDPIPTPGTFNKLVEEADILELNEDKNDVFININYDVQNDDSQGQQSDQFIDFIDNLNSNLIEQNNGLLNEVPEDVPIVPEIESDKTPAVEPESTVDVAPLAPTDSAPGPDPIPPAV